MRVCHYQLLVAFRWTPAFDSPLRFSACAHWDSLPRFNHALGLVIGHFDFVTGTKCTIDARTGYKQFDFHGVSFRFGFESERP